MATTAKRPSVTKCAWCGAPTTSTERGWPMTNSGQMARVCAKCFRFDDGEGGR